MTEEEAVDKVARFLWALGAEPADYDDPMWDDARRDAVRDAEHMIAVFPQLAVEGRQEHAVRHGGGRIEGPFMEVAGVDPRERRDGWLETTHHLGWRAIDRTVYEGEWTEAES